MQKKKIIIDLDVVTVAEWNSHKDAINFISRVKKGEFNLVTPYILLEHLSNWNHKELASKIEHFYNLYSKTIISAQNVLKRLKQIGADREQITNKLILIGVKEEDAVLVLVTSIFEINYLVTYNRRHLKSKEKTINEELSKNGLKNIKIRLPNEI